MAINVFSPENLSLLLLYQISLRLKVKTVPPLPPACTRGEKRAYSQFPGRKLLCMQQETQKAKHWILKLLLLGAGAGLVNGFLGSGGGIVILSGFLSMGIDQKQAHASAILAIAPLSVISVLVYAGADAFSADGWLPLVVGGAVGGLLGALALGKVGKKVLDLIFTGIIIFSGIRMLV